jgi:hypothetical protein
MKPNDRRGFTAGPVVIVILVIAAIGLVWIWAYDYLARPGGRPHSLHLAPPVLILTEGVPATVYVQMVLNHPLPNPTTPLTWNVDIDEDDRYWDDDLVNVVAVSFASGAPYASGSFQLVCRNLDGNGYFDLEAFPTPADVSRNEWNHQVHAEGPGDNSANISVQCIAAR